MLPLALLAAALHVYNGVFYLKNKQTSKWIRSQHQRTRQHPQVKRCDAQHAAGAAAATIKGAAETEEEAAGGLNLDAARANNLAADGQVVGALQRLKVCVRIRD